MTKDLRYLLEKYEDLYSVCDMSWNEKIIEIEDLLTYIWDEDTEFENKDSLDDLLSVVNDIKSRTDSFYKDARRFADNRITELEEQDDTEAEESIKALTERKHVLEQQLEEMHTELEDIEQEIEFLQEK